MNDLRAELDQLQDARLDYVLARSKVNSDAQGYKDAGVSKATFYSWPAEEREQLNELAQRIKREVATRVLMVLQDSAEQAATVKVAGLKSRNEHIKQDVASEILDRILGKATQRAELTGAGGGPVTLRVVYEDGHNA
jgi:alanyl-tRNA synthetase